MQRIYLSGVRSTAVVYFCTQELSLNYIEIYRVLLVEAQVGIREEVKLQCFGPLLHRCIEREGGACAFTHVGHLSEIKKEEKKRKRRGKEEEKKRKRRGKEEEKKKTPNQGKVQIELKGKRKGKRIFYEEQVIGHQRCHPTPTTTLHPSVWGILVRAKHPWGNPAQTNKYFGARHLTTCYAHACCNKFPIFKRTGERNISILETRCFLLIVNVKTT
jgi:hypothetical protein